MRNNYSLKFAMKPADRSQLLVGNLFLMKDSEKMNIYLATSSTPGNQYEKSWEEHGGLIPPGSYAVNLHPIKMLYTKGIEGDFFPITPFSVPTPGVDRSDFGIHYDANVPGSLGCIVLPTVLGWNAFKRDMENLRKLGLNQIPLSVLYPMSFGQTET